MSEDFTQMNTTDLAIERSRLAAERTLMAWIRTSLSMISFGFTIFKFFQYIQESGMQGRWQGEGPRYMGTTLVILGTLILIPAVLQHRQFMRLMKKQSKIKFPISLALVVAAIIALLGLMALSNLFFHFGPV